MTKRLLIDAVHPEETRVALISEKNTLEEFDYESSTKSQIKGNIYLAKVVRVEPSLQACFVDYGGNRHGFVAFSEIHPDYFRIPMEDRQALLEEEKQSRPSRRSKDSEELDVEDVPASADDADVETDTPPADTEAEGVAETSETESSEEEAPVVSEDDDGVADDEERPKRFDSGLRRRYKVQEVIRKNQIMLVQVVKEERGNKCAALTSYLSVPGRYCVLMPNSANAGGISRKINGQDERKKLRETLDSLDLSDRMSIIVRTAGAGKTKQEIKKDFEYLMRTWTQIRDTTLESVAPTLIYKEGDLIQQALRDMYANDVDEILVEGDEGYKTARAFMKKLLPSHLKRVKAYDSPKVPLFQKYDVETQVDQIFSSVVRLPSGGYIVIHPTEALVAIDVNSGRATKQRNIEQTALKTNLEAAEEVARQLRLRDLAGLVVVDFIDMVDRRNSRKVEGRLRDALRQDRARMQVGRLSQFGLMELSRQRLKRSIFETSTEPCPHCHGSGVIRSSEFSAMRILRGIVEQALQPGTVQVHIFAPSRIAAYLLNEKREVLSDLEARHQVKIAITNDDDLVAPNYRIERTEEHINSDQREERRNDRHQNRRDDRRNRSRDESAEDDSQTQEGREDKGDKGESRRGRRGGRKRRRDRNPDRQQQDRTEQKEESSAAADSAAEKPSPSPAPDAADKPVESPAAEKPAASSEKEAEEKPKKKTRSSSRKKADTKAKEGAKEDAPAEAKSETPPTPANDKKVEQPVEDDRVKKVDAPASKPKKGWWDKLVN